MSDRPNILVLMTDQQRADAMSCAGNPILRTPAMDAIAASGVRFTDACASTPVCVASRMSFITGHRAARTHWVDNRALPGPVPELLHHDGPAAARRLLDPRCRQDALPRPLPRLPQPAHHGGGRRINLAAAQPELAAAFRERALEWERTSGVACAPGEAASFRGARFRTWPTPSHVPSEEDVRDVAVNEGPWPKRVPDDEAATLENFAAAFTRAISKETALGPDKLSLASYKRKISRLGPRDPGGESLVGTPWEQAWHDAGG